MACEAPAGMRVPSCKGPQLHDQIGSGLVFCKICGAQRKKHFAALSRMHKVENSRVQAIMADVKNVGLTGASLQKKTTARAEQVMINLISECMEGTPPADFAFMACGSMARREMVTYSDIDAVMVISNSEPKTVAYFEHVLSIMKSRLIFVASRDGGESSGFRFCPTGLDPLSFLGTPERLVEMALDSNEGAHVRGALHTRMITGEPRWAKHYNELCDKALQRGAGNHKANAVKELVKLVARKQTDLKPFVKGGGVIDLKAQIYRITHLSLQEVSVYYGFQIQGVREQVVALTQAKHMSLAVANIFMENLESYAKIMTEYQASVGVDLTMMRTKDLPTSDPNHQLKKLSPRQLQSMESCLPRVELIWRMTEIFMREKSKTGPFARKANPFTSPKPWADFGIGLRA